MYIDFGKITSTHGIRGEVKIYPYTDDVDNILSLKKIYIEEKGYKVSSIKFHKNMFIAKLIGINTVEEAETFRNKLVQREIDESEELDEDTYYIKDLIGLDVYLEKGELFGKIKDVFQTGANDVYVIRTLDEKEVLIPAIKSVVKDVDITSNKMIIELMEGLI
jgi:16S rRNA processing protein RimM